MSSPDGVLPGVAALELVLARTDRVAVGMLSVYGYPQGFELELRAISGDGEELDDRLYRASLAGLLRPDAQGLLPPETLRLGVELADGPRVSNVMPALTRSVIVNGAMPSPTRKRVWAG